jgi:hypothetical protein
MSTNAIILDGSDGGPMALWRSIWRRAATVGLAAGLVFLLAGDHGARSAPPAGIDPLEVLNLQVRANAFLVLDSSGSMRERPDCVDINTNGNCDSPTEGELVGDDQNAKMFLAKQVLKQVVTQNQTKVSFEFGRYVQANSYGPEASPYLYTCLTTAPSAGESACTSATANFGFGFANMSRATASDFRTAGGVTTYYLNSTAYHVNKHYFIGNNSTSLCTNKGTNPSNVATPWAPPAPATNWNIAPNPQPYVEIERFPTGTTTCTGTSTVVRYYFRGVNWNKGNTSASCGGFDPQTPLAPCNNDDQISTIGPFLEPEVVPTTIDGDSTANLRLGANGIRASGFTPLAESLIDIRTLFGTSSSTGLWGSGATPISGMTPKPSTFVIIVTDGDDTCTGPSTSSSSDLDGNARRAAAQAQLLYGGITPTPVGPIDPASKVKTFIVVLGSGGDASRANQIAWAGSGMVQSWTTLSANISDKVTGGCPNCQDAFLASDAASLASALQTAIDQGQTVGEFSDQQSITESVYEFAATVTTLVPSPSPSPDPLNPAESARYGVIVPVLLQSTFEIPGFKGHLNAFRNNGTTTAAPAWAATNAASDAGQKLEDRLTASLTTPPYTFGQLRGGTSPVRTDLDIRSGGLGTIRRRIYTTPQNGVFISSTYGSGTARSDTQRVGDLMDNDSTTGVGPASFRVAIWPPTTGATATVVDPTGTAGSAYPAGILDNALGIGANPLPTPTGGSAPTAYTFAQLQTLFGACTRGTTAAAVPPVKGGAMPPDCNSGNAALQLAAARKEARQILLAYTAGAELVTVNGLAVRAGATTCTASTTLAVGDIASTPYVSTTSPGTCSALQFTPRSWLLAESTLAAPGVVTPPVKNPITTPQLTIHTAEYDKYVNGPAGLSGTPPDTGPSVLMGFGLRTPDGDAAGATPSVADSGRLRLKPVMSVVYHATNAMLHAFRAGPCRNAIGGNGCLDGSTETGGEELWGFVPYDQLQNLQGRMKVQSRDPHTYMIATPVRFTDVFVPGTWTRTIGTTNFTGTGVWRTVLIFGRGIAGKYYTALDITAPGPFTEGSLATKGPIPLWSRGNPDTIDLTSGGTANHSSADTTAYALMGQTWATPAMANVDPTSYGGLEFVAYTGSGFGSGSAAATEGTTFFTLDTLTGNVVATANVGDRTSPPFDNAIVAGPSAFEPLQLSPPNVSKPPVSQTQRIYFGDINGRVWRVMANAPSTATLFADLGANQPIGNTIALLNYDGTGLTTTAAPKPHVYVESGNDNRITPPPASTPPFKMFGLRDDDNTSNASPLSGSGATGPAQQLFFINFPDGFRGNVNPATAFAPGGTDGPLGRVFFVGNKFNPVTSTSASCASSFDAVLFAVTAELGSAAYDLNSGAADDRSITRTGQRINAVRVAGGLLVVDTGLQADIAPPPPQTPQLLPPEQSGSANVFFGPQPNAAGLLAQAPVTYKVGSSICR